MRSANMSFCVAVPLCLSAGACAVNPDHDIPASTSSETGLDTTGSGISSTMGTSSTGEGPVGSDATTEHTSSDQTSSEASTGPDVPLEVLCHGASSEVECGAAHELCRWYESYRVADLASCALDEPIGACWATDPTGPEGCFSLYPIVCNEAGIQPIYREVDRALYLIDLEGACQFRPLAPEDEPSWTLCPGDESKPAPEACYCLCPGGGDTESSGG
jgi:hypothetical protein